MNKGEKNNSFIGVAPNKEANGMPECELIFNKNFPSLIRRDERSVSVSMSFLISWYPDIR